MARMPTIVYVCIGLALLHSLGAFADGGPAQASLGPRVLHFPPDRSLGKLTNPRRLQISHIGISDDTVVKHLTGLKHLERLSIGGNGLTDDGVAYLAQLPNLTSLTLSGTFTDSALKHLRKLQNLELPDFMSGANFTPRALNDSRASMPNFVTCRDFEKR